VRQAPRDRRSCRLDTVLPLNARPETPVAQSSRLDSRSRDGGDTEDDSGCTFRAGAEDSDVQSPPNAAFGTVAAPEDARQAANALHVADEALGEIHTRLLGLEGLLRPVGDGRRRSPRAIAGIEAEIHATLQAIKNIVNTTVFKGRPLLKGDWSFTLTDHHSLRRHSIRIRSLDPSRLGSDRIGYLASIRNEGANTHRQAEFVRVYAVVAEAAGLVSRIRDEMTAFSTNVIGPLMDVRGVATENVDAAETALQDADFAITTSHLTQIDVLLGMSDSTLSSRSQGRQPALKLYPKPDGRRR